MKLMILASVWLLVIAMADAGEARKWRVKPNDLAADYAQIIDQRPGSEVVVVYWIAPETMNPDMPNIDAIKAMLKEHMLVAIAHGSATATGRMDFRVPQNPALESIDGKQRQPVEKPNWPSAVAAFSTLLQSFLAQSLGQLGEGFHWFVFDATGIDSCAKGRIWLQYAGERYSYDTPIPGCSSPAGGSK
jgi:hypothetical protein